MLDDDDERDRRAEAGIEDLRRLIVARADSMGDLGWLEVDVPAEIRADGKLRVPRGAFEMWAVARSAGGHLVTPWEPISPPGMKQDGDDRFHTDWMLGAGLKLTDMRFFGGNPHAEALGEAVRDASFEIQQRVLGFKCDVLLQGEFKACVVYVPTGYGDIPDERDYDCDSGKPVVILPDAGPDWFAVAHATLQMGGAVIVERGGEMAHLVTALRDGCEGPILRIPDARKKFAPGAGLYVSAESGEVTLHDTAFSPFANVSNPFRR